MMSERGRFTGFFDRSSGQQAGDRLVALEQKRHAFGVSSMMFWNSETKIAGEMPFQSITQQYSSATRMVGVEAGERQALLEQLRQLRSQVAAVLARFLLDEFGELCTLENAKIRLWYDFPSLSGARYARYFSGFRFGHSRRYGLRRVGAGDYTVAVLSRQH